jgi:hypothetical protein
MNDSVPYRWIYKSTEGDLALLQWPPRSPYPTNMIFFSPVDYVKETLYLSVLPRDLDDLQQTIATVVALIDMEMMEKVFAVMGYRVDVCRSVTINSLKNCELEPKFELFYIFGYEFYYNIPCNNITKKNKPQKRYN